MSISLILLLVVTLARLAIFAFVIYAAVQGVKALRKYNRSGEVRKEKAETRRSLGEVLKEHRVRCKMTQEFVAESLGVSRQAVSKWETGTADPQHLQSAGAGEAVRCIRGGAAAAGGPDGRGRKLNQTAAARKGRRSFASAGLPGFNPCIFMEKLL